MAALGLRRGFFAARGQSGDARGDLNGLQVVCDFLAPAVRVGHALQYTCRVAAIEEEG